jgi:hypothetical protein
VRTQLINGFCRTGGPGSRFKSTLDKLSKNLNLPKAAKEELGLNTETPITTPDLGEKKKAQSI